MRKPLFDENGEPRQCGCVVVVSDDPREQAWHIEHCPKHKPAWHLAIEAILRGKRLDIEDMEGR